MPSRAIIDAALEYLEMVGKRKREEKRVREAVAQKWATNQDVLEGDEDAWLWDMDVACGCFPLEREEEEKEEEEEEKELEEIFIMTTAPAKKRRKKRGGTKHKK